MTSRNRRADLVVAPADLRDFLKSLGWSVLEQALTEGLFVLHSPAFPRRQLVFPRDAAAPDYAEAVEVVVAKVCELTETPRDSVIARISAIREDVIHLRVVSEANGSGLPFRFAGRLLASTETLLKAAACAVLSPSVYHSNLSRSEANRLVHKAGVELSAGQGIYELRVSFPLNTVVAQSTLALDDPGAPFVRQVTLALNQALGQVVSALETGAIDGLVGSLQASKTPLVSANVCEALAGMHDGQMANSLVFVFDWSVMRRLPPHICAQPIQIPSDYFAGIEELRRGLRAIASEQHAAGANAGIGPPRR